MVWRDVFSPYYLCGVSTIFVMISLYRKNTYDL